MATCKGCAAQIDWVTTEGGSRIPMDLVAVPDGNVIRLGGRPARVRVLKAGETPPEGVLRFHAHWATCPNAKEFRHRKAAGE